MTETLVHIVAGLIGIVAGLFVVLVAFYFLER